MRVQYFSIHIIPSNSNWLNVLLKVGLVLRTRLSVAKAQIGK